MQPALTNLNDAPEESGSNRAKHDDLNFRFFQDAFPPLQAWLFMATARSLLAQINAEDVDVLQ